MSARRIQGWRRVVAMVCGMLLGVAVLQGVPLLESAPAQAADLSQFVRGNIIDDALFWDGTALSDSQIQDFLNSKVSACASGYTCLKDYRETTHTIGATPMCGQYDGQTNESAATIISRVGQLCGVSPKVLLVMLQKEQGLVSKTAPSATAYRSAMGAGCPDTAACDSNYYGFFNQVHYAAFLLKRYTQPPGTGPGTAYTTRFDLRYPVGQTSAVLTNTSADCPSLPVYISNQATHALYIYTPYTPNQEALDAGYGLGNGCSAYGNRNFYNYYVDWFGSVRGYPVGVYFRDYYASNSSWLGYVTGPMTCNSPDSGCVQRFQGGLVTGSYSTAAAGVHNDFLQFWGWYGRELGTLGYPVGEYRCDNMTNGCRQEFQGGWIVNFTGSGTSVVTQSIRQTWSNWGREYGPLGAPTTSGLTCNDMGSGACRQEFQGGWVVESGATTNFVPTAVLAAWKSWGREYNVLGLPTGSPSADPTAGNYTQSFQGGVITVKNGVASLTSSTDPWINALVTSPWLGASTQAKSCTLKNGACYQAFQNGWIVQGPTGVFAVSTAVLQTWGAYGREYNILGFPSGKPSADPTTGNYSQAFQGGVITVANGAAALTSTTDPWLGTILSSAWLGTSTQAKSCTLKNGACFQAFQNGWIVQSPTGVFAVPNAVLQTWGAYGREYNILGFPSGKPSADPTTGNYTQAFQGGVITVANGAAALTSTTDPWLGTILSSAWLGTSTQAKSCTLKNGACFQAFQNGWIVQSPTGVFAVPNAVLQTWGAYGREYNILGFPSGKPSADPTTGNYTQAFQGGVITVANGAAALTSTTDPWLGTILSSAWLGTSTQTKSCTLKNGACFQAFQNGWVVQSPAGVFAVPNAVLQAWGWYGREYDVFGFPTSKPSADPTTGNYTQTFQGGKVTVTNGTPVGTVN